MLKREIYKDLVQWKYNHGKRALLVTGARQVGKSYIIDRFAKENYKQYIKFDLIEQKDLLKALSNCQNSNDVFITLSAFGGSQFKPGNTCIFIDEVQEYKEAITFVKYLCQIEGFDIIFSGSLLGVELQNIKSQPVGYMDILEMYPLNFEEFCSALNVGDRAIEHVKECYVKKQAVIEPVYEKMLTLFHKYLIVGGMPAAVQAFVDTNNIDEVKNIQKGIITLYKADISKYARRRSLIIKAIYDQIPSQLDSQSKKFNFSALAKKGTYERYIEEFIWMVDAGVVLPVLNVNEPRHPLKTSEKPSFFKLFANDVGLLCAMCEMDIYKSILSDNLGVNFGAIYENAIAQEFHAHGKELRFYRSKKMGEIDFIIENGYGQVLPIEVKSGKYYKRHSALNKLMSTPNYSIEQAYVLCESNVHSKGNIFYLPVFMVMCIN